MRARNIAYTFIVHIIVLNLALELSIIHLNDFHARFEEISVSSGTCKAKKCIGGFSRVYTAVNQLVGDRPNPIFLNAGDNFQGTPWYNLFKWNVTQYFLNLLPSDALTLGNHEFDDGIEGVVPFLKTVRAPIVVCNINDTLEPAIQGLYKKSVVIERESKKIGIVGVISTATKEVARTGKLSFLDESKSINLEAKRLLDEEKVFTVIVLSHCGFEVEQSIAKNAISGITVIVGGHSHTLLYTGTPPNGNATDLYPTVITSVNNESVLIVQADAYTRYLGNLSIEYDINGKLIRWDGNPIYLDENIPKDSYIDQLLEPYRLEIEKQGNRTLGETNVFLDHASCGYSECNLGNIITDSMVAYYTNQSQETAWTKAVIAIINSGAIRTSIDFGEITWNELKAVLPFDDTIDYGELQGKHIKVIMENAAAPKHYRRIHLDINLIQVSGIKLTMDLTRPVGSRVVSLKVRCHRCKVPQYEDIDLEKYYPIALTAYLARGGDNHTVISDNLVNHTVGPLDVDILARYISMRSPVIQSLEERIIVRGLNVMSMSKK